VGFWGGAWAPSGFAPISPNLLLTSRISCQSFSSVSILFTVKEFSSSSQPFNLCSYVFVDHHRVFASGRSSSVRRFIGRLHFLATVLCLRCWYILWTNFVPIFFKPTNSACATTIPLHVVSIFVPLGTPPVHSPTLLYFPLQFTVPLQRGCFPPTPCSLGSLR